VALHVSNGLPGCFDDDSAEIVVTCGAHASFTASARAIQPGGIVTFTNTSTGATAYEWQVDGVPAGTSKDLVHTFSAIGGYRVRLIASNGICSDTSLGVFIAVGACGISARSNVWLFGTHAGIDFNGGSPAAITGGATFTTEGTASVCDRDGNLLFYSDGTFAYNKLNQQMPNGVGLGGSTIAAQAATIIPMPGSDSLYYVVTTPDWQNSAGGMRYSIVDMSLDGGRGDLILSRMPLNDNVAECAAVAPHANCRDMWLVSHEMSNDRFVAYLITPSGINRTPVVSQSGVVLGDADNHFGCLKFSRDGKHLSMTIGGSRKVPTAELFDFDNVSGRVSNAVVLGDGTEFPYAYSSEFSPNGELLYLSNFLDDTIFQFDLTASNIRASKVVAATASRPMSNFQLGPDGRIYVASRDGHIVSAIENPNLRGRACGFVENAVDLGSGVAGIGLPPYVPPPIDRDVKIGGAPLICINDSIQTYKLAVRSCSQASYAWQVLGDAAIIAEADSTITLKVTDSGEVRLIGRMEDNCGALADTLNVKVSLAPAVDLGRDTALCTGAPRLLDAGAGFTRYLWQDGSAARTYLASTPGIYWVEVERAGCIARDTIVISPPDAIALNLGPDTSMCDGAVMVLDAGPGGIRYRWQDGSSGRHFTAYGPGRYWVEVDGYCGNAYDTITIGVKQGTQRVDLGRDTTICDSTGLLLDAGEGFISYRWQDGSAARRYAASRPGTYWVEAIGNCGRVYDTITIGAGSPPISLGRDTMLCGAIDLVLDPGPGFDSYQWQDGSTARTYHVTKPGRYEVNARMGFCVTTASINVGGGTDLHPRVSLASVPTMKVAPGSEVDIPLLLETPPDEGSLRGLTYRATIHFNGTLLMPLDDSLGTLRGTERVITIRGTIVESDTLTLLRFLALLGDSARTSLVIDSFSVENSCVTNAERIGGSVGIDICETGGERLVDASGAIGLKVRGGGAAAQVEYSLVESGPTRLSLVDAVGRRVNILADGAGIPGHHTLTLDTGTLPQGLYFIVLETPSNVMVDRVIVGR
jgi:hypothetical protein